ncbi:hypothetical protein DLAC_00023 [Tieghemostelium lacteum]|uniref:Pentacotripeptide-repeat region of PRORP domain-containing protein n=1 Tax=Tieghemostelium lacteum TaxID=361077 RepID=A0A152A8Q1_TIELA|nr:hypothetical protein DLAC_00023 [Tieghemostelium lacteum]|eukprot:KYR02582.1 hypothetical protein DLAC_00023 [Tieghemostelium lacteum]
MQSHKFIHSFRSIQYRNIIRDRRYFTTSEKYIPEEKEYADENDNFDWLIKRTNKKVNTLNNIESISKPSSIENINNIIQDKIDITKRFTEYFNEIKEEELKHQFTKAKEEIENNNPIDGANLSITTLIRVCGKISNKEQRVKEIIKKLLEVSGQKFSNIGGSIIDSIQFQFKHLWDLAKDYQLRGKEEMVNEIYQFMKDNPDRVLLEHANTHYDYIGRIGLVLIESYANQGELDNALKISKELKEYNINSQSIDRLLIKGYANSNRSDQAVSLLLKQSNVKSLKTDSDLMNSIIYSFSRQGNFLEMDKFFTENEMDMKMDHYTVEYLIQGYLKSNQYEKAISLLNRIDKQDMVATSTLTYNYLFKYLASINNLEEMMKLFENSLLRKNKLMVESIPTENDYSLITEAHDKPTRSYKPNINTINWLINASCQANDIERAYSIYSRQLERFNLTPSIETYSELEAISFKLKREDLYKQYCSNHFHLIKKSDH